MIIQSHIMKIIIPLALAASLPLISCSSDPLPQLTRSSDPEDSLPSQSISFDLGDTVMEEDVDSVVFHAAPWDGEDVGAKL